MFASHTGLISAFAEAESGANAPAPRFIWFRPRMQLDLVDDSELSCLLHSAGNAGNPPQLKRAYVHPQMKLMQQFPTHAWTNQAPSSGPNP